MSGKNQYPSTFNWQSTNPQTGFIPNPNQYGGGSLPSGTVLGAASSTSTIYSNIIELSRMDNTGIEFAWTGTTSGTLTVLGSVSGLNWFTFTFTPSLGQPAGTAGCNGINLNQFPYKYLMFKYVNSAGTGTIAIYAQLKDLN